MSDNAEVEPPDPTMVEALRGFIKVVAWDQGQPEPV